MAAEIAPAEHRAQKIQYQCCKRYPNSPQLYTETVIFEQKPFQPRAARKLPEGGRRPVTLPVQTSHHLAMTTTNLDPQPQPPDRPDDNACCNSGCTYCVLDMYQDELAAYHAALRAWQQRNTTPTQDPGKPHTPD